MTGKAEIPTGWLLGDIGNSRVKLVWMANGRESAGRLWSELATSIAESSSASPQPFCRWDARLTLPTGRISEQSETLSAFLADKKLGGIWLSSVHGEAAQKLVAMIDQVLESHDNEDIDGSLIASAADVVLPNLLQKPDKTGADRALAVRAAMRLHKGKGRGIVVLCGTALTVEWIDADEVWAGGAIAPGVHLGAMALNQGTAALPFVTQITKAPLPFGTHTQTAIDAGLFWGQVGTARELIQRITSSGKYLPDLLQVSGGPVVDPINSSGLHWEIWSGGDAHLLAPHAASPQAHLIDDLVLLGLADLALAGD